MGALREGLVDLEIGVLGKSGPEIRVQTLFRDHFVVAVRSGHPLLGTGEITAEGYAACGHVVASRRGHESGPVDEALGTLGVTRTVVAVVPSFRAALSVASVSDLVALVTDSFFNATQGHRARSGPADSQELPTAGPHRGDHGVTNVAPPPRLRSGASLAARLGVRQPARSRLGHQHGQSADSIERSIETC